MSRGHEIRVGSAPSRSLGNTSLSSSYEKEEIKQRGYLNRGTMGKKTKVLHREKNWHLCWCNLRGSQLEMFKMDGVKVKPGDPPPRDIYPPANLVKSRMEILSLDGALVELDYVSQENKDIQKRRKNLFRVELKNDMVYILQAPTENTRSNWVLALRSVANKLDVDDSLSPGHAIKTTRDSIKHTSKHNTQRSKFSTGVAHTVAAQGGEESDYIEFSTAEAMVAAGGDPRLQTLRKRLQAKKELLKQLDRMYSSFLGGNAAAMYDDTLILQQMEPPTFHSASPILSTAPPSQFTLKKPPKQGTYQVVHRKLTLSESGIRQNSSSIDGSDGDEKQGSGVGKEEEVDKRISTGEVEEPAVITSSSPLPYAREDVLETELLIDYYLVPGAEWSLLKKGETVQVIGKARENGWYRCMAHHEAEVKLDRSPFPFMIKSMLQSSSMERGGSLAGGRGSSGVGGVGGRGKGNRISGITPEMIEEEYTQRDSLGVDQLASDINAEGSDTAVTPPPLLPRSCPPTSFLRTEGDPEEIFPSDAITSESNEKKRESKESGGLDSELSQSDSRDSPDSRSLSINTDASNTNRPLSSGPSPELSELSSFERTETTETLLEEDSLEYLEKEDSFDNDPTSRKNPVSLLRRPSYQKATTDYRIMDKSKPMEDDLSDDAKTRKSGEKSTTLQRSTSALPPYSAAAIQLRKNLGVSKSNRVVSSNISGSLPSDNSAADVGYLKMFSPQSRLDDMINREMKTGSYPAPLIGCIPPSALKCFAGKEENEKHDTSSPQSPSSPTHSRSDDNGSGGDSESISRPVSDQLEGEIQVQSQGVTAKMEPVLFEVKEFEHKEDKNERKSFSSGLGERSFSISISMDDDSDGEADRRQAVMFKTHEVINPDEDRELLETRRHVRAVSLPPPMNNQVMSAEDITPVYVEKTESSLDRKPSYLRAVSPDPKAVRHPPSHSVGSSPAHKPNPKQAPPPKSPSRSIGKGSSKSNGDQNSSIGGLFDVSSKPGLLKKLFTRKIKGTKLSAPEISTERISSGPPPGVLKQILLNNEDPYNNVEDDDDEFSRARVSSMSGRPVRQKGMAILIGDESSSESEGEEDANRRSSVSSPQEDNPSHLSPESSSPPLSPTSPTLPINTFQSFNLDQIKFPTASTPKSAVTNGESDRTPRKLKRSASDHDSLNLKASLQEKEETYQARGTNSLKRNVASLPLGKKTRKPRTMTTPSEESPTQQADKKHRPSKRRKKRPISVYDVEKDEIQLPGSTDLDPAIKICGIFRQPPRGEKRYVYLDPSRGKYGFRLQSYGRLREQGKVLQTFVQSVVPGSPSFMAGLYPGDAIVEVNGKDVKYAPVEEVVKVIQEGTVKGERIALKVEFVDGVTRLDCMKKADEYKIEIKARQNRLRELLESETKTPLSLEDLPSPNHVILASDLPPWGNTKPNFEARKHTFPYSRYFNEMVAVHSGSITALQCDVLVMPISSCHKAKDISEKNILLQLLRTGGPGLLDDLSLAKQCKVGENISTWGHELQAKYVYHCVFGDLEESLQSCCYKAMESASSEKLGTIVFWLDGFASLSVSPHIIIDAVRSWLQQDSKKYEFVRVVFSSKANASLVEKQMHTSFSLFPSARQNDGSFIGSIENGECQNGIEQAQIENGEVEMKENGYDVDKDEVLSTEELLESLQAIQDETMRSLEELVGKISESDSPKHADQDLLSQSLPGTQSLGNSLRPAEQVARSVSPSFMFEQNLSRSEDKVHSRIESDV